MSQPYPSLFRLNIRQQPPEQESKRQFLFSPYLNFDFLMMDRNHLSLSVAVVVSECVRRWMNG